MKKSKNQLLKREQNLEKYTPMLNKLGAVNTATNTWVWDNFIITVSVACKVRHKRFRSFVVPLDKFLENPEHYKKNSQECYERYGKRKEDARVKRQQEIIDKINEIAFS